jgi:hypothetical protein
MYCYGLVFSKPLGERLFVPLQAVYSQQRQNPVEDPEGRIRSA